MGVTLRVLTKTNMVSLTLSLPLLLVGTLTHSLPSPQLKIPFPRRGVSPSQNGDYSFSFSNTDQKARQSRQESGFGSDSESVEGSYSFTSPEGEQFAVSYTADQNGYFPRGPGIHPALLRALEHLRKVNGI